MTDPAIETSKAIRPRSLRFIQQSKTTTDYELPSLRAKPRKKQACTSGSDNDSDTDNDSEDENDIELDELSDSPSEDHDFEQDSDDGSVFSMDEADELDNEEELASPTRKDRQRRRQHDTSADDNTKSSRPRSRKRQIDNDDDDSKTTELNDNHIEQATSINSSPNGQHLPKRRKLRPSHSIQSTTLYNGLLSDDSDLMDQDIGLQYPSNNDRRGKSTTTSPLVLGSPSKVVKLQSDTGRKQQPSGDIDTFFSSDQSRQSSSPSTAHGLSPSSKLEDKKWPRRPQASAFLDKLQANAIDTLDLSQHSFIPDDFMEPRSTAATASTRGSSGTKLRKQAKDNSDTDDMDDSDSMAYQYDFSTISEPNSVAVNPISSDATVDDQGDPHTHQLNTDPPTPTPNTTRDEQPQQSPGFFRRIASFFFG